jgi:dCMP deaminase
MLQAMMASFKSKDPNTKVGCVFVDKYNHQITMGYNGMIAGVDESQVPWSNDRTLPLEDQKYGYVIHGEANAISHRNASLEASRGYVTLFPCNECAKLIATHKVGEIIYLSDKYADSPEIRISKRIFDLCGVKYRQFTPTEALVTQLQTYFLSLVKAP